MIKTPTEYRFCLCGCGEKFICKISSDKKFLKNHYQENYQKNKNHPNFTESELRICLCGCKGEFYAKPWRTQKFIRFHWLKGLKRSDETKQKLREKKIGDKNPNYGKSESDMFIPRLRGNLNPKWNGGITPIYNLIRSLPENDNWRKTCFQRDKYFCQKCDVRGGNLIVHHKKQFSIILREFLKTYSQFSPIEDKDTLVRLAITYPEFWDTDNGETLCEDCHKIIPIQRVVTK